MEYIMTTLDNLMQSYSWKLRHDCGSMRVFISGDCQRI